jgi:hypothetical protein
MINESGQLHAPAVCNRGKTLQYLLDSILNWTWWEREIIPASKNKSIFAVSKICFKN